MDVLDKLGQRIYEIDGHIGFLLRAGNAVALIKPWSKNRQFDNTRVVEIAQHLKQNGWVNPMIHVANVPLEGLVCYEGNHRLDAYRQLSPCLDNKHVIVDALMNANDIYMCFNNLAKSVPLAEIDMMMDNNSIQMRKCLDEIVNDLMESYPSFVSTSSRCKTPHFNKDVFKSQIQAFLEVNDFNIDIQSIKPALGILNNAYANDVRIGSEHKKLRPTVVAKCQKGGLWLFAWNKCIPNHDLEWAIIQQQKPLIHL